MSRSKELRRKGYDRVGRTILPRSLVGQHGQSAKNHPYAEGCLRHACCLQSEPGSSGLEAFDHPFAKMADVDASASSLGINCDAFGL